MKQTKSVILQFRQHRDNLQHIGGGEQYQVDILKAPGRGWGGPMTGAGIDETHLHTIRQTYRGFLARQQADENEASEWTLHPLRLLGSKLFRALPESVQARLQTAQALAREQACNLAITLVFDPSASSLLDLPWELLHDPDGRFFYSLRGGGITRRLLLPTAVSLPTSYQPQHTIGLWAQPHKLEPLSARHQHGPAPNKQGPITWLQGPDSLGQLQCALEEHDFDALHITAHGRVGAAADFALALEGENGRIHWCSPQQLALLLSDYPALRIVYLDVCGAGIDQASMQETELVYQQPGGAAVALLGTGVTAVVVMQDVIGQAAAGVLAATFYQKVADGAALTTALTQARRAVQLQLGDTIHWSVPALYLQQQPPPEESAPIADWLLDHIAKPGLGRLLLFGWVMALLIGRISMVLARFPLDAVSVQPLQFTTAIVGSSLIPLLAALLTRQGEQKLIASYKLSRRDRRSFLLDKYFAAFTWSMLGWGMLAGIWLTLAWSGITDHMGSFGRQIVWAYGLLGLALAAHTGARQAIRQALLFRRVGIVPLGGMLLRLFLLIMLALVMPVLIVWLMVFVLVIGGL